MYEKINGVAPSQTDIDQAMRNNIMNQIELDINHACSIAAMILETESKLNLKEKNRLWSLPELYNTVDQNDLYNVIESKICKDNYQNSN